MQQYYETNLSKQLIRLNSRYLSFIYDPQSFTPNNRFEKILKCISNIAAKVNRLRDIGFIDKKIYTSKIQRITNHENDIMGSKIAVYSAMFGKYDNVYDPLYISSGIDYYFISDNPLPAGSKWQWIDASSIIFPSNIINNDVMKNRYLKFHPENIFSDYEYSIYIDSNVIIFADLMPLLFMMPKNTFLGIHLHSKRSLLKTEAKAIAKYKKFINKEKLLQQVKYYYDQGYKDEIPLLEATILIRRHNDKRCIQVMNDWWAELMKWEKRDQISLPYVLWKNGYTADDLYILGDNEYINPRFRIMSHRS